MKKILIHHGDRMCNHYYTMGGDFLGMHGFGQKIRVYNNGQFYDYEFCRSKGRLVDEQDVIKNSVGFSGVPEYTRLVIIRKIAETIGLFNVARTYIPSRLVSDQGKKEDSGYVNHRTGQIMINPNSRLHVNGDYFNILLTLYHEKYHYEHHYKKGMLYNKKSVARAEYDTYKYIYNHHLYYESTDDYQGMVFKEMCENAYLLEMQPEL